MAVEKINPEIESTQEYKEWKNHSDNETPNHVRECLEPLTAKRRNDERRWLTRHVLVTLFCAQRYKSGDDETSGDTVKRLHNLEEQLKVFSKLTNLANKDPGFALRFFLEACYPFKIPDEDRRDLIWKTGFSNYKKSLEKEMDWIRKSQKRSVMSRGGILYPRFNANGKMATPIRDPRLDSKLFHLTYIFHHFTEKPLGKKLLNLGTRSKKMPRFGSPHYDVTAKILHDERDSHSIRNRIDRLKAKGVYIGHWPPSL